MTTFLDHNHFKRLFPSILILVLCLAQALPALAAPPAQGEAPQAWTYVAPGVDYQKFHINNGQPVDIFVTRMDRANPNVTIETGIGQGRLSSGTETVLGMTARYNQTINYWGSTWGNRSNAVVAVNGYFFGVPEEPPGVPWSGVVNSGWYASRYYETRGDAGFAWMMDRNAHIGACVTHNSSKNYLYFVTSPSNYSPNIRAINVAHNDEALILYTPQFNADSGTDVSGDVPVVEILVEMTRPSVILSNPDSAPLGTIRQVRHNQGSTLIPFDHVVISAWGTVGDTMWDKFNSGDINIGDPIRIVQQISNCAPPSPTPDWTKTYAALGGDYHFLTGGVVRSDFNNPDAAVRNARTAVGFNASYVFFVVVDSHNPGVSMGINIGDLGNWMKNTLSATDAVSLDSGTSSTMVVNGTVVNNTQCTYTRNCGTQQPEESTPGPNPDADGQEAAIAPAYPVWSAPEAMASVGTALMMVVVEPVQRSAAFTPTQAITTTAATQIRLGPGTNYAAITTIPAGTHGEVLPHLAGLNGVLAKGSFWWKVDLGDYAGWVRQEDLAGGAMERPYHLHLPSISKQAGGLGPAPVFPDISTPMNVPGATPGVEPR